MPLISAKCTNCGATLQVDNTKDAAICEYCGSAFIVEKAVNYYNTTNQITAGVVNIYGGNSADFIIRAGVLEKYTGASTEVVIPNTVKIIGESAFENCSALTSVVIPDGVIEIRDRAFYGCSLLVKCAIPNSVSVIGYGAFRGCSRFKGSLHLYLDKLEQDAFCGCSALSEVVLEPSLQRISQSAFHNCVNLQTIVLPSTLKYIGECAFFNCTSLHNINLPSSLEAIGESAFYNCSALEEIVLPYNLSRISSGAFSKCKNIKRIDDLSKTHIFSSDIGRFEGTALVSERRAQGRCLHCGGKFKGLLSKTCSSCGKLKDYKS